MLNEEKIEKEFWHYFKDKLTEKEFDEWVMSWMDGENIRHTCRDWDLQTKKEAIEEFKLIVAKRKAGEIKQTEVLFYNGNSEPAGYELLDIDTTDLTKEQIKKEVEKLMKDKYGLKWDNYSDVIYLLDIEALERLD